MLNSCLTTIQPSFKLFAQDFLSSWSKCQPPYCVFTCYRVLWYLPSHTSCGRLCLFQHMRHNIVSTVPSDLIGLSPAKLHRSPVTSGDLSVGQALAAVSLCKPQTKVPLSSQRDSLFLL